MRIEEKFVSTKTTSLVGVERTSCLGNNIIYTQVAYLSVYL